MLRHTIAVTVVAIVFVAALMYCITPDLVDASVSVASYRVRVVLRSISGRDLLGQPSAGARDIVRDASSATPAQSPVSRPLRGSVSDSGIGPDPFRPYSWRIRTIAKKIAGVIRKASPAIAGVLLPGIVAWVLWDV